MMNIIVVDDEKLAVDYLILLLEQIDIDATITGFVDIEDAFNYMETNKVDIIFLDIEMGTQNGIMVAQKCSSTNIVFVTAYPEYSLDAFAVHASGYLLKPVRAEDLKKELDHLRYPIEHHNKYPVFIQTFGNFEIFVNGEPLEFSRNKSKECIAYLVDRRGATISMRELAAVLWEDRPYDRSLQNYLYQVIHDLMTTLKKNDIEYILNKNIQGYSICISKLSCDYYEVLNGNQKYMDTFTGEYMSNYSWAEYTLGELYIKIHGHDDKSEY